MFYTNKNLAEYASKYRELGYFSVQSFFYNLGINFWIFHIVTKFLVFYSIVYFIRLFNVNIFLFLSFFIPEIGLYLFIDCPFRNLISFGFSVIAFRKLFENNIVSFFIFIFIAINFHVSAIILLCFYFVYKKKIKTSIILILGITLYILAYNIDFLISNIYLPLTKVSPIINDRLKGYFLNSDYIENHISIGTFIRLSVLFIFVIYRDVIVSKDKRLSLYVYNLAILFLLIYPVGITMKIFNRFNIYLTPFYILAIIYLLQSFKIKSNKYLLLIFFVLLYFKQTYSLITYDYRYVPYSNYIAHWIKNDLPSIKDRKEYNIKHSPYKEKNK